MLRCLVAVTVVALSACVVEPDVEPVHPRSDPRVGARPVDIELSLESGASRDGVPLAAEMVSDTPGAEPRGLAERTGPFSGRGAAPCARGAGFREPSTDLCLWACGGECSGARDGAACGCEPTRAYGVCRQGACVRGCSINMGCDDSSACTVEHCHDGGICVYEDRVVASDDGLVGPYCQ